VQCTKKKTHPQLDEKAVADGLSVIFVSFLFCFIVHLNSLYHMVSYNLLFMSKYEFSEFCSFMVICLMKGRPGAVVKSPHLC
jgi:hypothetical protein